MNIDKEEISGKSEMMALLLTLLFGSFGVHRFYVGKYISGCVFLLLCNIRTVCYMLYLVGVDYTGRFIVEVFANVFALFLVATDVYALYSESFVDSKGKLIVSKSTKEECGVFKRTDVSDVVTIICVFIGYIILRYVVIPNVI